LVAILTHLDSLNGAALTMEQHILANRKHGNVDDQRRLALRIYDEAFMKCAVASAAVSPNVVLPLAVCQFHHHAGCVVKTGDAHGVQHDSLESFINHSLGFVKAAAASVSRWPSGLPANAECVPQFLDPRYDGRLGGLHCPDHSGCFEELVG
jgi:hypothetical protein